MGTLSVWHILAVVAVVAVVFGHRHIPAFFGALGRTIGRSRRQGPKAEPGETIEGTFVRRDD